MSLKRILVLSCLAILAYMIIASCRGKANNLESLYVESDSTGHVRELIVPTEDKVGLVQLKNRVCQFSDKLLGEDSEVATKYEIELPNTKELVEISTITNYIGLPLNIKTFKGKVPNALATIAGNQRIIIYKKDLLDRLDRFNNASGFWSSMFILAHEVGHHLSNHFADSSISDMDAELQADRFAGATMFRLGADTAQTLSAIKMGFLSGIIGESVIHPGTEVRSANIILGYSNAEEQLFYHSALPPPIAELYITKENKTEFTLTDFNDPLLDQLVEVSEVKKGSYMEGIIVFSKISETDEAEGPEFKPIPTLLFVEITKIVGENAGLFKIGQRENFVVPRNFENLSPIDNIPYQNYPYILQRGNKIRFKFFYYKQFNHIFYLKYLER